MIGITTQQREAGFLSCFKGAHADAPEVTAHEYSTARLTSELGWDLGQAERRGLVLREREKTINHRRGKLIRTVLNFVQILRGKSHNWFPGERILGVWQGKVNDLSVFCFSLGLVLESVFRCGFSSLAPVALCSSVRTAFHLAASSCFETKSS